MRADALSHELHATYLRAKAYNHCIALHAAEMCGNTAKTQRCMHLCSAYRTTHYFATR